MGKEVAGGGGRKAEARAASVWDTIDDVTTNVLRDAFGTAQSGELWRQQGIRVISAGGDNITIESGASSSDGALDKMYDFERRIKAAAPPNRRIIKVEDRERRDADRVNSYRWISKFRMTAIPRVPVPE